MSGGNGETQKEGAKQDLDLQFVTSLEHGGLPLHDQDVGGPLPSVSKKEPEPRGVLPTPPSPHALAPTTKISEMKTPVTGVGVTSGCAQSCAPQFVPTTAFEKEALPPSHRRHGARFGVVLEPVGQDGF